MTSLPLGVLACSVILFGYTYFGYPALLAVLGRVRPRRRGESEDWSWSRISISVPAYNEEAQKIGRAHV